MKTEVSIKASSLIKSYKRLGVDIARIVDSSMTFTLLEDPATGVRQFIPAIAGDEKFYQELSVLPWYYKKDKPEFNQAVLILQGLSTELQVLEIGCAKGDFGSFLIEKLGTRVKYRGLEINSSAASAARQKGLSVVEEDIALHAQRHSGFYDIVISFQVLEHLPDPSIYFSSIQRLLKRGGVSILSVPAQNSFMAFDKYNPLDAPPHHLTRWSDKALDLFPRNFGLCLSVLKHLPVELEHTKAFFNSLISSQLSQQPGALGWLWKHRLPRRITAKILSDFLGMTGIDPMFSIPGHTVLAVHRKDEH